MSQSPNPGLHDAIVQFPPLHPAVPFASTHCRWHAPQLFGSFPMFVSQPSLGLLLQSAKPGLQARMEQVPPVHPAVPCGMLHTWPHVPQLLGSPPVLTSQPFGTRPSQSAKPGLQAAIVHIELEHPPVPLGTTQTMPQPPQSAGLLVVLTSHPSGTCMS
jgi:hypothetical protein